MLEKELAHATAMAEKANKKVEQLRKKLVAESEKSHARVKRELSAARKKHSVANDRLKKARGTLRQKASPGNQQKVESLKAQVQDLGEALAKISKAAYEAADRYLSVKTDALLEARKASAADKAAKLVEQAAARADKKKAARKKAASRKKAPAKKKAAASKKAPVKKKAPAKKKAVAKKKAAARKKAPARTTTARS